MPHLPTIFDQLEAYVAAPVATLMLTVLLLALLALAMSSALAKDPGLVPSEKLTLRNFMEILLEGMAGQMEAAIGPEWHRYVPLVCTLGLFILISNLTGLIPFFTGPTTFIETNLAWAVISFVSYNAVGISPPWPRLLQALSGSGASAHPVDAAHRDHQSPGPHALPHRAPDGEHVRRPHARGDLS